MFSQYGLQSSSYIKKKIQWRKLISDKQEYREKIKKTD